MTNYRATADQWAYQEHWAQEDGDAACLLELRARVEALEVNTKQWRSDHLRLANTCAGMAKDRLEFFGKLLPDEKCASDLDLSLTQRVVMAITPDGEIARWDEARAAMLEIARWLESRAGGTRACWLLEREAQR
jgi:hypothetical protein